MERAVKWLTFAVGGLAIAVAFVGVAVLMAAPREPGATPAQAPPTEFAACSTSRLLRIEQESMRTTLEPDDRVALDFAGLNGVYQRGEIIAFYPVGAGGVAWVKRIIGVAGDVVELREGDVFVNGRLFVEPYVSGVSTLPQSSQVSWTIRLDELFVMGDNRNNSTDSRSVQVGSVPLGWVIGHVIYLCEPFGRAGPIK